jgi:hypothetical protein
MQQDAKYNIMVYTSAVNNSEEVLQRVWNGSTPVHNTSGILQWVP